MKVFIANDHAAFNEKLEIVSYLQDTLGDEVIDLGSYSADRVNYPDYALTLCKELLHSPSDSKGILVCGSGIGMSIAANKIKGIRAALCSTVEESRLSRQHNDANVLCLGARTTGMNLLKDIVRVWFEATFEGGRHAERVRILNELGQELK